MAGIDLCLDLGTSNTSIYKLRSGVVLREPSVVAVNTDAGVIKAFGIEAKKLIGKTAENTKIVFPIFEGEIVNEKISSILLGSFLKKIKHKSSMFSGSTLISVPCGAEISSLEKFKKVCSSNGLTNVSFVEAPILSAIGQHLPLSESNPCFVIDMGGGNTNIAALSLDGIIAGISVNLGGGNIDIELIDFVCDNYGLQIGLLTAERLKMQVGSLIRNDTLSTVINGRDIETGKPRSIVLTAEDIFPVVKKYYDKIAELAISVLAKLPAEVSAELRHSGIYVSGGGAFFTGLEEYYQEKFGLKINISGDADIAVISGAGELIGNKRLLKKLRINFD